MLGKIITGFFVAVLGTLWFFTRRCEIPHPYKIITYDALGRQVNLDGMRTTFKTHAVAVSFARHYHRLFPHYQFSLESGLPTIRHGFLAAKHQR